jgi:L-alanine-DL-glutamate epimerase-like enolase superfamily enzyme
MSIAQVEVIPIALPFRKRYRTASGELAGRSMVVVRILADSGAVGLGEAVPLSLRGGPGLGQVAAELTTCVPAVTGTETETPERGDAGEIRSWIWDLLERSRGGGVGPQVIAALDIALHDLAGRLSGMPVWRLLGASEVRAVRCNASIDAAAPEPAAALSAELRSDGFETFKVKVGTQGDAERVGAVRDAVGPDPRIRIDANGAWRPEEAAAMLGRLDPLSIELAEQPCAGLEGLASVRGRTTIPIVADESVNSAEEAEAAAEAGACDAVTIKLAKVGGPLEAIRVAAAAPSYLSSALDGPIGIAAAIHTAQALPREGYASGLAHGLATLGMFDATYAPLDGLFAPEVRPPAAPGLGVDVDPRVLEEFALR